MYIGTLYEIVGVSTFIITQILIIRHRQVDREVADRLASVFLTGLFFGMVWEPLGTGLVWSYQGFNLYVYAGVPLVIVLDWSWVMIVCYLISKQRTLYFRSIRSRRVRLVVSGGSLFLSGALVASIAEPVFVYLGLWRYIFVGERAVLTFPLLNVRFHLSVIVGWGILTVVNMAFSQIAEYMTSKFVHAFRLDRSVSLVTSSSLLGLYSGWLSMQLVVLFARLVEGI